MDLPEEHSVMILDCLGGSSQQSSEQDDTREGRQPPAWCLVRELAYTVGPAAGPSLTAAHASSLTDGLFAGSSITTTEGLPPG